MTTQNQDQVSQSQDLNSMTHKMNPNKTQQDLNSMTHKTHTTIQTPPIQDKPTPLFELVHVNLNHANLTQVLRLRFSMKKSAATSVVEVDSLGSAKEIGFVKDLVSNWILLHLISTYGE
nr:hypothetical protein CFP56_07378 [Quercus suber]